MFLPNGIGVAALAGLAWAGVSGAALAQQAQTDAAPKISRQQAIKIIRACRSDFETLCPDVEPGEGRAARCLMQHREDLSTGCSTAVRSAMAK